MDPVTGVGDLDEVRALLILEGLPGVGPRALARAVDAFGSGRDALAVKARDFSVAVGVRRPGPPEEAEAAERADRALADAEALGIAVVSRWDAAYPEPFRHLADPPPVLFLRGDVRLLGVPGVTVVGSRRASPRARSVAYRLSAALGRGRVPVVSGLALGVDGEAHRGALSAGGPTVAVLGRGADRAYPLRHRQLFDEIVADGLVISEFVPGTPPLPHHFPRRNRLLAGLARAVVVIEAGRRSGALITVEHALDLGVEVWAVPGPIDEVGCVGSNALLGDGALPLLSVEDFVGRLGGGEAPVTEPPPLDAEQAMVYGALGAEPRHVDEIATGAAIPVARALALLSALELLGCVEQQPGMRFRRAA